MRPGKRLIEPFLGSAAVFLNTEYDDYILADSNPDLINLFQQLNKEEEKFIRYCSSFFNAEKNSEDTFYKLRKDFNNKCALRRKAALFLYLNRHCYNGLCRYNSRSQFNTPFGRYDKPYFPEKEMRAFVKKAKRATFINANFDETMNRAKADDVVYCDPPYAPLTATAHFTDYHVGGFNWEDQELLANTAKALAKKGTHVVISNHDTKEIRALYKGAELIFFDVRRNISCNGKKRDKVGELLAIF